MNSVFSPIGTYSDGIRRLDVLIRALGCSVDLYNKQKMLQPKEYGGRISYRGAQIWINCPTAREALLLLAHEGGHWLSHLRYPEKDFSRPLREVLADHYGWDLLCAVGADKLVDHREWLEECRDHKVDSRK